MRCVTSLTTNCDLQGLRDRTTNEKIMVAQLMGNARALHPSLAAGVGKKLAFCQAQRPCPQHDGACRPLDAGYRLA
jgi:hypothetical protein